MPAHLPQVFLRIVLTVWLAVLMHQPAVAQSIPGLPGFGASPDQPQVDNAQSDLAAALREAAESGVSVVVIDSTGQIVTAAQKTPATEPANDAMEGASSLMHAQSRLENFRKSLRQRLDALPSSIAEVAFILRATSPDGRIMTYVEVLGWTVLLLVIGMVAANELYGKRFARRFIVGRVTQNPQGYREKMPFLVYRFIAGIGGTVFAMIFAAFAGYLIFGESTDSSVDFTVTAIFATFFAARTVSDLWRMILSPYLAQYRIPRFSDRDAKRLFFWVRVLATFDISALTFST